MKLCKTLFFAFALGFPCVGGRFAVPASARPTPTEGSITTSATSVSLNTTRSGINTSMLTPSLGWASSISPDGRTFHMYRTQDGGHSWTALLSVTTTLPPKDADEDDEENRSHLDVAFKPIGASECWVASQEDAGKRIFLVIRHTTNGGRTWARTALRLSDPYGMGNTYFDISSTGTAYVLVTGERNMGSLDKRLYRSGNAAATHPVWSKVYDTSSDKSNGTLPRSGNAHGMTAIGSNKVWLTMEYRSDEYRIPFLVSTDLGVTWKKQKVQMSSKLRYRSGSNIFPPKFFGATKQIGVVFFQVVQDEKGFDVFFATKDGGKTWRQTTPLQDDNSDSGGVAYNIVSEKCWFLLNGEGKLYQTTNGGAAWNLVKPNVDLSAAGIDFVSQDVGWAILVQGEDQNLRFLLFKTVDGGRTWKQP